MRRVTVTAVWCLASHEWQPHQACPWGCFQRAHGLECPWCHQSTQMSRFCHAHFYLCPVSLEHTFYQDLSGQQGNSEALGGCSAQWPTPEQTGPAQLSPQQPFALQPSSYPAGGGSQQTGIPVPLYAVPETHPPGTLGSVAVTGAPGERAWEEAQQMHSPPGKTCQRVREPRVRRCGKEQASR